MLQLLETYELGYAMELDGNPEERHGLMKGNSKEQIGAKIQVLFSREHSLHLLVGMGLCWEAS